MPYLGSSDPHDFLLMNGDSENVTCNDQTTAYEKTIKFENFPPCSYICKFHMYVPGGKFASLII